ncbi:MAG: hypothetical protein E7018_02455 [Alphaproteobacteria bacterium]|nr:hypothetical protein [Alphaproteobacteria bacterium]
MSEKLDLSRFEGRNIKKIYPCGEKRTGVPYTRDYYLAHPELLSNGKTRTVEGPAAEKIADNVKKFDVKTGVLSKALRAMKSLGK